MGYKIKLFFFRLARFYARVPWLIAVIALLVAGTATIVSYKFYNLTGILTFDDPTAVSVCLT